eukprot:6697983-Lingulodinium_polyedra.AAC.1
MGATWGQHGGNMEATWGPRGHVPLLRVPPPCGQNMHSSLSTSGWLSEGAMWPCALLDLSLIHI